MHIDVYVCAFYVTSFLHKGNYTVKGELNKEPYYSDVIEHVKMYEHYKYLNTKCVRDMLACSLNDDAWVSLRSSCNKQMLINLWDNHTLAYLKQEIITILYITNLAQYTSMSCYVKKFWQLVQINISRTQLYAFKVVVFMCIVFNGTYSQDGSSSSPN